jgi:hypothetical protein
MRHLRIGGNERPSAADRHVQDHRHADRVEAGVRDPFLTRGRREGHAVGVRGQRREQHHRQRRGSRQRHDLPPQPALEQHRDHETGRDGSASVTDDDGGTAANGRDPLVIGGDGYDDLGIRSSGNRNIVTYDDSNVVVGGTGNVASQIGDADTAGAVVMRIVDSHVEAGNAF